LQYNVFQSWPVCILTMLFELSYLQAMDMIMYLHFILVHYVFAVPVLVIGFILFWLFSISLHFNVAVNVFYIIFRSRPVLADCLGLSYLEIILFWPILAVLVRLCVCISMYLHLSWQSWSVYVVTFHHSHFHLVTVQYYFINVI
jgi:hypothetical protein